MDHMPNTVNKNHRSEQPSMEQKTAWTLQTVLRILLGAFLVFAGITHLTVSRAEFLAQVPTWLPVNGDLVVILSGIAEIALGLALIFLFKQRVLVGLAAAAFFLLVLWALWATGARRALLTRKAKSS